MSTQSTLRRLRCGEEGDLGHAGPGARQHRPGTGPASALTLARRWLARLAARPRPCCAARNRTRLAFFVCLFARVVACAFFPRAARHARRGTLDTHTAVLRALPRPYSEYSHGRGGTLSTHTDAAAACRTRRTFCSSCRRICRPTRQQSPPPPVAGRTPGTHVQGGTLGTHRRAQAERIATVVQLLNTHDHGSNHVPKSVLDVINDEVSTRSTP